MGSLAARPSSSYFCFDMPSDVLHIGHHCLILEFDVFEAHTNPRRTMVSYPNYLLIQLVKFLVDGFKISPGLSCAIPFIIPSTTSSDKY